MTAIKSQNRLFSIVIPTWNNLAFLKLCIQSIQRNSYYNHQIIVHVNDGSDGTLEWIKKQVLITHILSRISEYVLLWIWCALKSKLIIFYFWMMICMYSFLGQGSLWRNRKTVWQLFLSFSYINTTTYTKRINHLSQLWRQYRNFSRR